MEPGWEYYFVEGSFHETGVDEDKFTFVTPTKTEDEDHNVVWTAKNVSKGVNLDVEKVWMPALSEADNSKADATVELQYRTRPADDASAAWSSWANVRDSQGTDQPFPSGIVTTLVLSADESDAARNWRGTFEYLPTTVTIGENVCDVQYQAVETGATINNVDVSNQYIATTANTNGEGTNSDKSVITNTRDTVQVTVHKVWDPLPENGSVTVELHRMAKKTKGTLGVVLKDDAGAGIQGAVYRLQKKNGEGWEDTGTTVTTDVNGRASVSRLEAGTYRLVQISTPAAYSMAKISEADTFHYITHSEEHTVVEDTTEQQVKWTENNVNKRKVTSGVVTLTVSGRAYAYDPTEDAWGMSLAAPVAGATVNLYLNDQPYEDVQGLITDSNGQVVVSGLPAGEYYFILESVTDDHILPAAEADRKSAGFTIVENPGIDQNVTDSIETVNASSRGVVAVTLKRADNNDPIADVSFMLTGNGVVMSATTDSQGVATFGSLENKLDAGEYTIHQNDKVAGLNPAEDQTITLDNWAEYNNVQTVEVEFINAVEGKGSITVSVQKENNGGPIVNAAVQLIQGGAVLQTCYTNAEGIAEFENLGEGTYTVRQLDTGNAGDDYAVAFYDPNDTFTVLEGSTTQSKTYNLVNEEASGNATIRFYTANNNQTWGQVKLFERGGFKAGKTYRFKFIIKHPNYVVNIPKETDRIGFTNNFVVGSTPPAVTYLPGSSWTVEGSTIYYIYEFTPTSNDATYTLAAVDELAWGLGNAYNSEPNAEVQLLPSDTGSATSSANSINAGTRSLMAVTKKNAMKTTRGLAAGSGNNALRSTVTDAAPVKLPDSMTDAQKAEYVEDSTFDIKEYTITPSDEDWSHTFAPEDKYDSDGNLYYYYVVETDHTPENYWIESYDGDPLCESGTITITNVQKAGALTITKDVTVDGGPVPSDMETAADGTYTFTITGPNSYTNTGTITVTNGVATGTIVIEDLDPGDYTIVETGSTNPNGITLDAPKTVTVAAGSQASENVAAFTNNLVTADLIIHKVDADGMTTPLPGAKFEIRRIDGTATAISYIGTATDPTTIGTDNKTGADGIATFEKLVTGYYEVWERELPDGYILEEGDGKFYIKVDTGAVTLIDKTDNTAPVNWPGRSDETKLIFNATSKTAAVGNTPGVELPSTGGPGTHLIYLTGGMLTLAAGLLLLQGRKRTRS